MAALLAKVDLQILSIIFNKVAMSRATNLASVLVLFAASTAHTVV